MPASPTVGLLAGGGLLPTLVAGAVGTPFIVAFDGQTDPYFAAQYPHRWVRLAAIGATIRALKMAGVSEVVLAGGMGRPPLRSLRPDRRGLLLLHRNKWRLGGDDRLLGLLIRELESEGFRVRGAHEFCPELLLPVGAFSRAVPTPQTMADITLGLQVAKDLGRHDIGQAVVVERGQVLGVEGVEGTDRLLERLHPWTQKGRSAVLVKTTKPRQDMRVDLPSFGAKTLENAARAGLVGIVGEADRTLLLDPQTVRCVADSNGLFVWGACPA
jgi:UDP-2,3-diacylglucosamine hydrolase